MYFLDVRKNNSVFGHLINSTFTNITIYFNPNTIKSLEDWLPGSSLESIGSQNFAWISTECDNSGGNCNNFYLTIYNLIINNIDISDDPSFEFVYIPSGGILTLYKGFKNS